MKVLVADDESAVREVIAEYLTRNRIDVLEAANGLETLLQVKRARPAVVVLDLRMPRLGGLEALPRIRSFDPTIKVIVVTALLEDSVHAEALALGAHAVLVKPVVLPELLAAIRAATDGAVPSAGTVTPTPSPAPPPAASAVSPKRARVLVVDDEAEIRELLVEYFAAEGYDVAEAVDGLSAIRALTGTPADIVLLDIHMPGLSGAEALPKIRAVATRASVIMVSGNADVDVARATLAHGAFDYVTKPIDFAYLAQSIQTALAMRVLEP